MSELSEEQIKILEQTHQHLRRIIDSLYSFQRDTQTPCWSSVTTAHNSILSVQLQAYYEHLFEHASFLGTISVFPLPSFPPGKKHEILLGQVVRKKLDPEVEEWVSQAAEEETENVVGPAGLGEEETKNVIGPAGLGGEEGRESQRQLLLDLWDQAPLISNECAKEHSWGGDYTDKEEVEEGRKNVVMGLKRKLKDLSDEYEADEVEDEKEKKSVRMIVVQEKESEGEKKDVAMQPASEPHP